MPLIQPILAPEIEARRQLGSSFAQSLGSVLPVITMVLLALALVIAFVACLFSAIAMPGGIATQIVGLGVVRRDGREIGRRRSLVRALVVWAPAIAVLATMAIGAIWSVVRTNRGPHDWLVGTWLYRDDRLGMLVIHSGDGQFAAC